jgi:hypothetical protein
MKRKTGSIGINMGVTKDAVIEARAAIMDILKSDCEQDTKRTALTILGDLCAVKNCSVSGCNITMNGEEQ